MSCNGIIRLVALPPSATKVFRTVTEVPLSLRR